MTRISVSTCTRVPSSTSSIVDVIVAAAVPCPRLSRACARMTARWAASSASSIRTVPLYAVVIGPILIVMVPVCASPSAPSIAAPGQARRDALDVEQHLPGLLERRGDGELVLQLHRVS